jgi:hypothetical protein
MWFAAAYPIDSKRSADLSESLHMFVNDCGIPSHLIVDGAKEKIGKNTPFL